MNDHGEYYGLPGAPSPPDDLVARLRAAVAAKGPAYRARTRHVLDGGAPRYTNRLILETSPYLLQHAHNPVSWHPWGDDAFEQARRLGRPVFLSIGYSTCHWCHVMEEESFEDEDIARRMNERFVCIKVDREERPDVDAIYMSATQQLTGSGGWPMSVWLNADRQPFFAGTYFPPRAGARGARRGFFELLGELSETWTRDPERVARAAAALTRAVQEDIEGPRRSDTGPQTPPTAAHEVIAATVEYFKRAFDDQHGGLRRAPKFPSNVPVRLLLRHHRRTGDGVALHMATLTLAKMAAGGLFDHLGGGFHRYSTDERWLVPHFEKMLYDNALLAVAYAEAQQATGRADFARILRQTLDYALREMTSPDGGFYSATDADSEGVEGKFFVWSESEIRKGLGEDGTTTGRFLRYYDVTPGGNFEGANILNAPRPDEEEWAALAEARRTLYDARARRIPPLRDEKILAAWNGLMISAMAVGGRVLGEDRYVRAAVRAAGFVLDRMRVGGRLMRAFKEGRARPAGYLDDYAFLAAGFLDLYEASFEGRWLKEALALSEQVEALFADDVGGAWFMTARDHETLLAREKPNHDGAEPAGSSVALMNAVRLAALTDDDGWRRIVDRAMASLRALWAERPAAMTEALLALDFAAACPRQVAVVWPPGSAGEAALPPLLAVLQKTFAPAKVVAAAAEGPDLDELAATVPFVAGKVAMDGRPTAYVCEQGRCERPTTDPEVFARQLTAL